MLQLAKKGHKICTLFFSIYGIWPYDFHSPARAIVIYRESDLCAHLIGAVLTLDVMIVGLSCNDFVVVGGGSKDFLLAIHFDSWR